MSTNTVSKIADNTARRGGVILVFRSDKYKMSYMVSNAVALCFITGKVIRNDNVTWVRSNLEHHGIRILAEISHNKEQ